MRVSTGKNTGDFLSNKLQTKVINNSIPGSSNERILRTTLRDIISLKNTTKEKITAIISLSFIYRKSIWDPIGQDRRWKQSNDGEFACYQLFRGEDWLAKFLKNENFNDVPNHLKKYSKELATFFNAKAEVTNLLQSIELISTWFENNNIDYIIFSGPQQEDKIDFTAPFVESFYQSVTEKKNILNPWEFSFCEYCISQGFTGFDYNRYGKYAHHGEEAHGKFADFLLEKYNLLYEV